MCAANNQLERWDSAILACEKALELAPDNRLARANLQWAMDGKGGF